MLPVGGLLSKLEISIDPTIRERQPGTFTIFMTYLQHILHTEVSRTITIYTIKPQFSAPSRHRTVTTEKKVYIHVHKYTCTTVFTTLFPGLPG